MFAEFRSQYPQGTIHTEMLAKIEGLHAFRCTVSSDGVTLATAMGVDRDLEMAEDRAVKRALTIAGISENYAVETALSDYAPLPALSPASLPSLRPYPDHGETRYTDLSSDEPKYSPKLESRLDAKLEPKLDSKLDTKLEPKPDPVPESPLDLSDYIAKIDVEMIRVGWDKEQGRRYITGTFHKSSRQKLTQSELQQFLDHLRKLPTPQFTANYAQEF